MVHIIMLYSIVSIGNHETASTIWVNSTSDVWKFCQNWQISKHHEAM